MRTERETYAKAHQNLPHQHGLASAAVGAGGGGNNCKAERALLWSQKLRRESSRVHAVWIIFLFGVGACVGSFLNVVIWRLPRGESLIFPGSHCPKCGESIKWYDNVPLVSWFVLRGRCRSCKTRISPRYLLIEFLTAALVSGLYVCYFLLELREGIGAFAADWPILAGHAVLLCGLLAASAVDADHFIVPLPVMWVCAAVGIIVAVAHPSSTMPAASPALGAASLAAVVGLVIASVLLHYGWIQPSFVDAEDKAPPPGGSKPKSDKDTTIAISAAHGVNPRIEILRELLFLAPPIVLAAAAYLAATRLESVSELLDRLAGPAVGGGLARHVASACGAVFGMLIGGAWIWGTRILGTLAFGKEAMGMGDVHILAAVGAVAGWKVASLTFFAAPVFGLGWALYLLAARGKRELPYGPWLALGALVVLLFYDGIVALIAPGV